MNIISLLAGVFGVPIDMVGEALLEALKMYDLTVAKDTNLKHIHVIDINRQNIDIIIRILQDDISMSVTETSPFQGSITHSFKQDIISPPSIKEYDFSNSKIKSKCPVCFEKKTLKIITPCQHGLCEECLKGTINSTGPKCPTCGSIFGQMIGNQPPNGKMTYKKKKSFLPGYEKYGTIVITYNFPGGKQMVNKHNLQSILKKVSVIQKKNVCIYRSCTYYSYFQITI